MGEGVEMGVKSTPGRGIEGEGEGLVMVVVWGEVRKGGRG